MAHDVKFRVPRRRLGRSDVVFDVYSDGAKLGTLTVSKGSLVWFQARTNIGFKVGWEQFDRVMQENVTSAERR
jgi:hypothetical protein